MIENDADKFAMTGRIVIDAWFTDICTQLDVPMQVVMARGKISGEIDMSFGDAVAVQSVAVEAMSSACDEDANLWRMYTYDEEEIVA